MVRRRPVFCTVQEIFLGSEDQSFSNMVQKSRARVFTKCEQNGPDLKCGPDLGRFASECLPCSFSGPNADNAG